MDPSIPILAIVLLAGVVRFFHYALFDAKRSGRNTFRLYHPGLANTAKRTDQLAGVLSGDPTRDYRNTLMLLETIEEINKRTDFAKLLPQVVDIIVDLTQADCAGQGGDWQGIGSACATTICPDPKGACCFSDGTCAVLTESDCGNQGGS